MIDATRQAHSAAMLPEYRDRPFDALLADVQQLDERLAELDPVPLLLVYTHLSGDESLLARFAPYIMGAWSFEVDVPEQLRAELRSRVAAAFKDYGAQGRALPPAPDMGRLQRMCDVAVGGHVPAEYLPMVLEELNFNRADAKTVRWRKTPSRKFLDGFLAIVIGAGYSGLAMGAKLKEAGIPFLIIEKNADVGGTWYENTYPGVAVDTPNHFYSYSFRVNPDWDHYFAKGPEIISYIRRCCSEMGIAGQIRFGEEVNSAVWDKDRSRWTIHVRRADGTEYDISANAVISATGLLNRPSLPAIPGLDDFRGPKFHSARWDASVDLSGKRIAQIGSGASGMQIAPQIATKAAKLTIFQRSPHWAMKNPLLFAKVSAGKKWGLANVPYYNKWFRFLLLWASSDGFLPTLKIDPNWTEPKTSLNAKNKEIREHLIAHMREELGGNEKLLAKATPAFPPYGKRMLRDSNWFKTLTRDNVELVTEDDPRAYLGITVPAFPNLFIMYGPNTNGGHGGSAVFNSECQARYIMQALRELIEQEADSIEVRHEPYAEYNRQVDAELSQMVWSHPGVNNWYKNKYGRIVTNIPWRLCHYRNLTATFDPAEYRISRTRTVSA